MPCLLVTAATALALGSLSGNARAQQGGAAGYHGAGFAGMNRSDGGADMRNLAQPSMGGAWSPGFSSANAFNQLMRSLQQVEGKLVADLQARPAVGGPRQAPQTGHVAVGHALVSPAPWWRRSAAPQAPQAKAAAPSRVWWASSSAAKAAPGALHGGSGQVVVMHAGAAAHRAVR